MKAPYRLTILALLVSVLFPCSFDTSPRFIPAHIPEKLDTTFVNGKLGILPSTLSSRYKLIAWRYLAGLPIDQTTRDALVKPNPDDALFKAAQQWQDARKTASPVVNRFFGPDKQSRANPGTFYEDCLPDAFTTAVKTLNDRRTSYGNPQLLQTWISAQDQVFDNCHAEKTNYPPEPESTLNAVARADREYQIAAAHFYAEDYDGAEQRFRGIAADTSSPWRDTGAYMVGRTLIREFALTKKTEALGQARTQLESIGGGPYRDSAQGLIRYIESFQDPKAYLEALATQLKSPDFLPAWHEATFVLSSERFRDSMLTAGLPEPFDWIRVIESRKPELAVHRWRDTHSILWLTAAVISADAKADYTPDLIEAAAKVPRSSPAYDTAVFHSVRLLIESGKQAEARLRLDNLLSEKYDLDSFSNALRAERMSLATSYDDFLHWAPRVPIGYEEEEIGDGEVDHAPLLDRDSTDIFNQFTPVSKLAEASESSRLRDWPRSQLAVAAWTRAFLLNKPEIADREVPAIGKLRPQWKADLDSFAAAEGEAKRFAGAFLVERHSDSQPTVWSDFQPSKPFGGYGAEWWCAEPQENKNAVRPPEAALSATDQSEGTTEAQQVRNTGPAQNFLSPIVMSWANAHRDDPRVPEALYRLVRITRYGCRGPEGNGAISKAAFDLLHKNYPASPWTKQTPYWFDK